jgi:transketolase
MRDAFVRKLIEFARNDDSVYLITSDTGFMVLDEFQKLFPERFLNIGISEANMIGVAAGLALSRKKVFVYAIVPFVTMRCFEQVRVDLCYQNLPVKLIGIGGGLTYGTAGSTHHSIEDIAVMGCLPNMNVLCPGDPIEVEGLMEESLKLTGPSYLRLGKSGEKVIHNIITPSIKIGKGIVIEEGKDVAIIATGNMLENALNVCEMLKKKDIYPELISMHTVKPIDEELIIEVSKRCKTVITIEEHNYIGGLGDRVADIILKNDLAVRFRRFAIPDKYSYKAGSQEFLRKTYGLTAKQIFNSVIDLLKGR